MLIFSVFAFIFNFCCVPKTTAFVVMVICWQCCLVCKMVRFVLPILESLMLVNCCVHIGIRSVCFSGMVWINTKQIYPLFVNCLFISKINLYFAYNLVLDYVVLMLRKCCNWRWSMINDLTTNHQWKKHFVSLHSPLVKMKYF